MRLLTIMLAAMLLIPGVAAAKCGGSFQSFMAGLKKEAMSKGHDKATVDAYKELFGTPPKGIWRVGALMFSE